MAQPYVGEIRLFAGNFAPAGWMFCDGLLLPISENETLFNLIGTTYGGDGESTFALPDLRGRAPLHTGNGFFLAETGGLEEITLTVTQMPAHAHLLLAGDALANSNGGQDKLFARTNPIDLYDVDNGPAGYLAATAIGTTGGSQPHTNMQPYLAVSYIISLYGIFPSPT